MNIRFLSLPAWSLLICLQLPGCIITRAVSQPSSATFQNSGEARRPLSEVLKGLKSHYRSDIIYADKLVRGIAVNPGVIRNNSDIEQALQNILKGTNLSFRKIKSGAYMIIKNAPEKQESSLPAAQRSSSLALSSSTGDNTGKVESLVEPGVHSERTLTGRVTGEDQEGLPGVNVVLKGTTRGTSTDVEGNFQLNVPENQVGTLVFSLVGYSSREIVIDSRSALDIQLKQNEKTLDEVVVVGYGTVKKSDITGSVGSVSAKELTSFPTTNAIQGLQGRTPGVQVMQNSGAPGATLSVRVRGGNSLQGSNEPLYVVDGFALSGPPTAISPDEIESMEILKDASATAIYGSRGANGVVLITTKVGKVGKVQVSLDTYYAIQKVNKKLDLMNAEEFAILANERAGNDGFAPYFTEEQIRNFGKGTDWQDVMFRNAVMQNHALSISGGTENTQYSVSGNYIGQKGIIRGSNYERGNLRLNLNQKLNDKFRLYYNSMLSSTGRALLSTDNGFKGNTVTSATLIAPPTISPLDENGNYSFIKPYAFSPNSLENPLALAEARKQKSREFYVLTSLAVSFQPIKNLTIRSSAGVENSSIRGDVYSPSVITTTPTGSAVIDYANKFNFLNENTANYTFELPRNQELTLLGGITYQMEKSRSFNAAATGFNYEGLETENIGVGGNPGVPTSTSYEWKLFSYLGRANYSFKGRYLFTASIRADGSSRFGKANKWGYFPSAAFAWRIIDEPCLKENTMFSDLKLRTSYGVTGNTALAPYQTLFTLNPAQTVYNDQLAVGQTTGVLLTNPDLKWESTAQWNAGIDVGLLRNRFSLTIDYYLKNTRDLLAIVPLQLSTGYNNTIQNIGQIRNRGIELGLNATLVNTNALKWDFNINISRNRSKVLELAGGSDVFGAVLGQPLSVPINLIRVNQPIGVFYGYREDGLDEKGAIKYKDLNNDGTITLADKTIIGDPNPNYLYNFSSRLSYKNFTLTMFWLGKQGGDIFNSNLTSQASSMYFGENQLRDVYLNHWKASSPDPTAKYPKISANTSFKESDRFVEDGSFLRLKNIQLAYSIPTSRWGMKWLKKAELYVSGQNLLTFTKYSWFDPEVNTLGGANSISLGIDQTGYPTARIYTAGARLNF